MKSVRGGVLFWLLLLSVTFVGVQGADDDDVECGDLSDYKDFGFPDKCEFVKDHCESEGQIEYMEVYYCNGDVTRGFWLMFMAAATILYFYLLGDTAEEFFCPTLEALSEELNLSANVAGVTLLAFGNGAPDCFSSVAAFLAGDTEIGLGAIFGAGMFVTSVVFGSIIIFGPDFKLHRRPFLRDVGFYMGTVLLFLIVYYTSDVSLGLSLGLVALYVGYVIVVIVGRMIYQRQKAKRLGSDSLSARLLDDAQAVEPVEEAPSPSLAVAAPKLQITAADSPGALPSSLPPTLTGPTSPSLKKKRGTLGSQTHQSTPRMLVTNLPDDEESPPPERPPPTRRRSLSDSVLPDGNFERTSGTASPGSDAHNLPPPIAEETLELRQICSESPPVATNRFSGEILHASDAEQAAVRVAFFHPRRQLFQALHDRSRPPPLSQRAFPDRGAKSFSTYQNKTRQHQHFESGTHGAATPAGSSRNFLTVESVLSRRPSVASSFETRYQEISEVLGLPVEETLLKQRNHLLELDANNGTILDALHVYLSEFTEEMSELSWRDFAISCILLPFNFMRYISIPTFEEEHWNRICTTLCPIFSPLVVCRFVQVSVTTDLGGGFPLFALILIIGSFFSVLIWRGSTYARPPEATMALVSCAFLMSVVWIGLIASELVSCLGAIGFILNISQGILGLTVLAWGNSVGDLAANIAVARAGAPAMAIASCFAAPLFNALVGLGISITIENIREYPYGFELTKDTNVPVAFGFLLFTCVTALVYVPMSGFVLHKKYGIALLVLYIAFLVASLIIEIADL